MTRDDKETDQLPQPLVEQLRAADRHESLITARVDRVVMRLAHEQFASRRRVRHQRPIWAAIAATVLIALFVTQSHTPQIVVEQPFYADIDGSGQIDIADVLSLARSRDAEQLTQADIDAFAMRVVSLAPSGESS